MELTTKWKEKMVFESSSRGLSTAMDATSPIGTDTALNPKELLLASLCGCTAMDVVALMKKYRQNLEAFEVSVDADLDKTHYPAVFTGAHLVYSFSGPVDTDKAIEAVILSKTKYCGVSAMLEKAFPITYEVRINGETIKNSRD